MAEAEVKESPLPSSATATPADSDHYDHGDTISKTALSLTKPLQHVTLTWTLQHVTLSWTVLVFGSWDAWTEGTKLSKSPDTDDKHSVVLKLPCGIFEYKFFVPGVGWFHDEHEPKVMNVFSTWNNVLEVTEQDDDGQKDEGNAAEETPMTPCGLENNNESDKEADKHPLHVLLSESTTASLNIASDLGNDEEDATGTPDLRADTGAKGAGCFRGLWRALFRRRKAVQKNKEKTAKRKLPSRLLKLWRFGRDKNQADSNASS